MTLQEKLAAARTIANGTAKKQVSEPLTPQIKESKPGVDAMDVRSKLNAARTIANGAAKKQVSEPLTPQIKESMPGVDTMDVRSKLNAAREIARGTVQRGPSPTSTKTTPSVLDSPLLLPAKAALAGLTLSQKPMLDTVKLAQKPINAVVERVRTRKAEKREKQIKETQRLAKLDIGAARQEVSDMEAECAELEKEFRAAEDAQNVPMTLIYNDEQEAYDAALAAANERVNTAFAAWDAKKKDITAKKEEVEQAKAVQFAMIPTRDDFEVYAARGAAISGNPVVFRDQLRSGKLDRDRLAAQHMTEDELAAAMLGKTAKDGVDYGVLQHLTRQEKRIYNYLLAKDEERGTSYAREYLILMRDPLTAREGKRQADLVKNSGILRPVATVGYGVVSGLDKVATNAKQNFSDTPLHASSLQYGAGYVRDDLADVGGPKIFGSNWAQIGFDLANLTGSVAPSIAASVAGGPAAGAVVTFASAGGNAYGEALAQGYDQRSARAYGVLAGASEAGLQYVLGGISSLGGKVVNSNGIQAALNNIERAVLRIPAKYAVAAAGEMTEEYLQEILTPVFKNLALGENNEFKLFTEDAAYSALLAALSVGVLEGPNIVSTDVNLDRMGQALRSKWGADASSVTDVLIRMGLNQEQGSDAYQAAQSAQKRLDKGGTLTNVALGSLYQNVMGAVLAEGSVDVPGNGAKKSGEYRLNKPQNVEMPTVPIINLSVQDIPVQGDTLPTAGNILRSDAIQRARVRLGLDKNSAAYIPASNVMRDGNEYVLKITKRSLNKLLSPADGGMVPLESIVVIDNIERIANNGVWFDSQGDRQGRTQIAGFDHLKTTVYIDGAPFEVDMRVKLVEEVPGKGVDNVLYYFTPEEVLTIRRVGTTPPTYGRRASILHSEDGPTLGAGTVSPTDERRALIVGSETMPTPSDRVTQNPGGVNLRRSLPGDIPADIPPGLHGLYRLAQEMSTKPQPREIPQRPVQQSPQEILTRLAQGMARDSLQGGALDGFSDADLIAMLDEIVRRQSGESAQGEADISGEIEMESEIGDAVRRTAKGLTQGKKVVGFIRLPKEIQQSFSTGLERAAPEAQKALQDIYQKADYILGDEPRSYYAGGPLKNIVYIGKQASPSTVAHELFHQLDRGRKISQPLTESLMKDYIALNVKSGGDIKGYLMQIFPEMFSRTSTAGEPLMGEPYRGISDILNGLSGGKTYYGYGHGKSYWSRPGSLEAEAWAQFGRVQFENQSGALKMFQKLFPNFYESAIMALKGLV